MTMVLIVPEHGSAGGEGPCKTGGLEYARERAGERGGWESVVRGHGAADRLRGACCEAASHVFCVEC